MEAVMPRILIASGLVSLLALTLFLKAGVASPADSVSGELVETYCWGSLQIGGPAHASCGIECAKRGIPLAVYDAKARKATILLPGKDKTSLPPDLIRAMGRQVTVQGNVTTRGEVSFILVQSWKTK
jgi:hypothetical protein